MEEEIKSIEKAIAALKKSDIYPSRIASIEIKWDKLFEERAFPNIKIKLYKEY